MDSTAHSPAVSPIGQEADEESVSSILRRNASIAIKEHYSLGMSNLLRMGADEIDRLEALLRGRDDFLVSKDLFQEFVETIPTSTGRSIAEKP